MDKQFLMGNEAIALGARDAGVTRGVGYPGTPSSEILNFYNKHGGKAQWSPNEKVAAEVALGVSFSGVRSFVTMKHVGMNVAADVLFTCAYSGVDGALVFIVADDPGMASSQNEQDTRRYAVAAGVPLLEPADSQEAYDFTRLAFEISEKWKIPVILRVTTRVCHSGAIVERREATPALIPNYVKNSQTHVMVPGHARPAHVRLRTKLAEIQEWNNNEGPNTIIKGCKNLGLIANGVAYQYAREAEPTASVFKVGMSYPLPISKILEFTKNNETNMVIEEGDAFIADAVLAEGAKITRAPFRFRYGELNVNRVRAMIAQDNSEEFVPPRGIPPKLCMGCPHLYSFQMLKDLDCIIAGDIGCYTLAVMPPLDAMDTQICMGASIGVGLGLRYSLPEKEARRVVSVIGDSTFVHSGLTGLAEMQYNMPDTGHVLLILDNSTTAMTGQQEHPGTGKHLDKTEASKLDYETVVRGMNIKNVITLDPFKDKVEYKEKLQEALAKNEITVFILKRPCILAMAKQAGAKKV